MAKISKTNFLNYMRCPRYVALEKLRYEKGEAVVAFDLNATIEELLSEETNAKKQEILAHMYEVVECEVGELEEVFVPDLNKNITLDLYMEDFKQIEVLAAERVESQFGGQVVFAKDTNLQKYVALEQGDHTYYSFIDIFQEDDDAIRIFEVKATTTNKFLTKLTTKKDGHSFLLNKKTKIIEDVISTESARAKVATRFDTSGIGRISYDLAYQRYVVEQSRQFTKPVYYYLAVLNHEYTYDGKTNEQGERIYDPEAIISFIDYNKITEYLQPAIAAEIKKIEQAIDLADASKVNFGVHCQKGKNLECQYFSCVCKQDWQIPDKYSIFEYIDRHHGFKSKSEKLEIEDLVNEGTVKMTDVDDEYLNREKNKTQKNCVLTGKEHIDEALVKKYLDEIKFPIYHLDFESTNFPLPRYIGEKPYTQSLFQFSIHIEKEFGKCDLKADNVYFLNKDTKTDYRYEFTKLMLETIKPDGGSVMVYNKAFENTRIKELMELFKADTKMVEGLQNILNRIYDLMYVFKGKSTDKPKGGLAYYHRDLYGSYSIKKLLPVFTDLSYKNLEVQNGLMAVQEYLSFTGKKGPDYDKSYAALLAYCGQDTYSMHLLLKAIAKKVGWQPKK